MPTDKGKLRLLASAMLLALGLATNPAAHPAPTMATGGFVTRSGTRLMLDGNEYRFTGANIYSANSDGWCGPDYTDQQLADAFDAIGGPEHDPVVVRAWFFQSLAAAKTPGTTHQWSGARDWSRMDRMLSMAAAHNVKVIPTLTDNWGECGAPIPQKDAQFYVDGYQQPDPTATAIYDHWVSYYDWATEIVSRYRDDPTVLFWQLINEAEVLPNHQCAPGPEPGDILKAWADDVSTHVRSLDPNHLISLGTLGSGQCGTPYTEYQRVHDLPNIDLCEYHDYDPINDMPGDQWNGLQERINECTALNKPIFVGELGIVPDQVGGTYEARAERFRSKVLHQQGAGVVGHLAWAYMRTGSTLFIFDIGTGDPALDALREGPAWAVNSMADTDDGACDISNCTLREAINAANANAGSDTIGFNLAPAGAGVQVIAPTSLLPAISGPTVIDGTTDPNGMVELDGVHLPNSSTGLYFTGGYNRLEGIAIGGFDGFFGAAVVLDGLGHNVVVGNVVGLRADYSTVNANWLGIRVMSPQNVIGQPGNGNVLAGNDDHGIQVGMAENPGLDTHGNVIQANVIGYSPGPNGNQIISAPNHFYGIELNTTTGTIVGGSGPGEGNTISGNDGPGIVITSPSNLIQGNRIGTDVTGMIPVPNVEGIGVAFGAGNVIGGTGPGEGNLLSGNTYYGIQVDGPAAHDTTILGNWIGTNATGNAPLSNMYGIFFSGTGSSAGGAPPGSGNVISGNTQAGVLMGSNAIADSVTGNLIGVGADGTTPVPNGSGVLINENAHDNVIGGEATGEANVIAHNTSDGVHITLNAVENGISANSIFANGGLGINIGFDGATANDIDDVDGGPNHRHNAPVLASARTTTGVTIIMGTVDLAPGTNLATVDFYANSACDPSGYGEGETFLGNAPYAPNAAGDIAFTFNPASVVPGRFVPVGQFVTAVATTNFLTGDESSEFSNCVEVTAGGESASGNVGAGGTVTTDTENDGATPADPVETSVSPGVAGHVTVTETPTAVPPPVGYSIVGFDISISAPASSAVQPIRITVRLDASAIPAGETAATIQLVRDGQIVPDCGVTDGTANPDPCVSQRSSFADGDIGLTALSSHASLWQLAVHNLSPYATQRAVLADLRGLGLTGNKQNDTRIRDAIAELDKSVQTALWADASGRGRHLSTKQGKAVFDAVKAAVQDLDRVTPDPVLAVRISSWIRELTTANSLLVQIAIFESTDAKAIVDARNKQGQAQKALATGNYAAAFDQWKNAWSAVTK